MNLKLDTNRCFIAAFILIIFDVYGYVLSMYEMCSYAGEGAFCLIKESEHVAADKHDCVSSEIRDDLFIIHKMVEAGQD